MQPFPDCATVSVRPAMVSVPERLDEVLFAATLNEAVPLPLPDPLPTVIHETLLVVDQVQPLAVVTAAEAEPAVAATVIDVGEMV
ncbi:MAG TPA: hypothetical protein VFJ02_09100 [Vicinamibacterales bacterium]|nr:hypothetical protein [Vicinamibacterales bacterium]